MSRGWNGRLILGAVIWCGLLVMLVLPEIPAVPIRDPHVAQTSFWLDGMVRFPPLRPGEAGFVLGTDRIGRDLLARIVYGARMTLLVSLAITGARSLIAVPLGLWGGWCGGWVAAVSRLCGSALGAVPTVIAGAVTLGALRYAIPAPQAWVYTYCAVMVILGCPRLMEHVRQRAEEVSSEPFIEAAVAVGGSSPHIVRRHVLPHLRGDIAIAVAFDMAWTLMVLGQLAVLGIFVGGSILVPIQERPPILLEYQAEWGQMLGANLGLLRTQPWVPAAPAIALGLAALACHLVASGLEQGRGRQ